MSDAKAITYDEWCRRGGGPRPPDRDTSRLGVLLRNAATKLIDREIDTINAQFPTDDVKIANALKLNVAKLERQREELSYTGLSVTFQAAATICNLAMRSSGPTHNQESPRP